MTLVEKVVKCLAAAGFDFGDDGEGKGAVEEAARSCIAAVREHDASDEAAIERATEAIHAHSIIVREGCRQLARAALAAAAKRDE